MRAQTPITVIIGDCIMIIRASLTPQSERRATSDLVKKSNASVRASSVFKAYQYLQSSHLTLYKVFAPGSSQLAYSYFVLLIAFKVKRSKQAGLRSSGSTSPDLPSANLASDLTGAMLTTDTDRFFGRYARQLQVVNTSHSVTPEIL